MSKLHIKKGDTVYVNAGEDKGKTGRVLSVLVKEQRAIVEGINMVSKSTKPNAKNPQGGIVKKEAPIHISNLNPLDPKTGKPTRIGRKKNEAGVSVRYSKKSGEEMKKIVINQGLGEATADKKIIETAINELTAITGQKAVATLSRKDISNFKLRKKMPIGVMVTLRRERMYEFLERLVRVSLPRIRDFKGIESKLDGRGNYTLGIQEQIIFPEINIDSITKIMGMNITFVTSAKTDEEGYALLKAFGLPFKNAKKD